MTMIQGKLDKGFASHDMNDLRFLPGYAASLPGTFELPEYRERSKVYLSKVPSFPFR